MNESSEETATSLQLALLMAALADGRSRFAEATPAEATPALIAALLGLGVAVIADEETRHIDVAGTGGYWPNSDAELDMHDSFALTCLLAAACSVGRGQYTVACDPPDGDDAAFVPLFSALVDLRASVAHDLSHGRLTINVGPEALRGGTTRLPTGCPPAVLASLLVVAPYAASDVMIEARGTTAHATQHVIPLMDTFGVSVIEDAGRFIVPAPQRYQGREISAWGF